jgi:succinate dehydrogenase / fumarate reductase cytochrome b subunit
MAALLQTASGVLRYRGGAGQWAWAIHRAAGLGVLAFLLLHIFDIFLAAFGPQIFNDLLFLYKGWASRILEILLLFGLLYHALNGLRIILMDFFPIVASRRIARNFLYIQIAIFLVLFVPAGIYMMYNLPADQFGENAALSVIVTFAILALPAVIVGFFSWLPLNAGTKLEVDPSTGNYQDGFDRIVASRTHRVMNRGELNIWLFMRISGFLLIVLALGHFFLMHFIYGVESMDFNFIIDRWMDPSLGLFWRSYDLALLFFALLHGMFGLRYSIDDYIHNHAAKFAVTGLAVLVEVAMLLMGAFIIFTFNAAKV